MNTIQQMIRYKAVLERVQSQLGQLTPQEAKTGQDGVATFSDVPVGIYMVEESDAPSQVIDKTANFLVSIPMTEKDASGDTYWEYDVEVQAKNQTVYGGVNLIKKGKDADKSTTTTLDGVTFKLEKRGNSGEWELESTNQTAKGGQISIDGLAPGVYKFTETAIRPADSTGENAVNQGYILDGTKAYEFAIKYVTDPDASQNNGLHICQKRR